MAIKTSELTKLIAEQVTKDVAKKLIPKLRRVVREEIDRSMKDMIYEMVMKQQTPLQNVVEENVAQFEHHHNLKMFLVLKIILLNAMLQEQRLNRYLKIYLMLTILLLV